MSATQSTPSTSAPTKTMKPNAPRPLLLQLYSTTVGKKIAMAVSGLIMIGFVVGHMLGNLKVFGGVNAATGIHKIDEYAVMLREIGAGFLGEGTFLWIARIVLLGAVAVHVISAIQLARLNRSARPEGYRERRYRSANAASRTMLFGGLLVLFFIVFHILHFTVGAILPGFEEGAVYANLTLGFGNVVVAGFYVLCMAAVSLHLYHGTWSVFQTLGIDSPRWNGGIRTAAKVLAITLFLGFSAVPISFVLNSVQKVSAQDVAPAVEVAR